MTVFCGPVFQLKYNSFQQGGVPHSANAARVLCAIQRGFYVRSFWKR